MKTAILTIVLFCVMIFPHELGHFLAAGGNAAQHPAFSDRRLLRHGGGRRRIGQSAGVQLQKAVAEDRDPGGGFVYESGLRAGDLLASDRIDGLYDDDHRYGIAGQSGYAGRHGVRRSDPEDRRQRDQNLE